MTNVDSAAIVPEPEKAEPLPDKIELIGGNRFKTVELQWPVLWNGREITAVNIRRMTAKEVGQYIEQIREKDAPARFPMADLPDAVLDELDDDDADRIDAAIMDFLPQRLRRLIDGTSQSAGDATSPSSQNA